MRAGRLAVMAATIALIASGCGLEAPPHLTIVAKDFSFSGVPQTIAGGPVTVTFRNEGQVDHEAAFLNIGDTSFEDFKKDFPQIFEGGPFPKYFRAGSVPVESGPGKTKTTRFTLSEGKYLLVCALSGDPSKPKSPEGDEAEGKLHYELGMVGGVTVEAGGGELSAPDGEIVVKDYTFDVPPLKGGTNNLIFRNAGPKQWHFGELEVFPVGTTAQQAEEAFGKLLMAGEDAPPPAGVPLPEDVEFSGVFSPGLGATFDIKLLAGRTYLFACFIQDLTGGPPHAIAHKMYKAFTVG